ncbi:hypothetical protein EDD18DRAFT_1431876 [Armillaria luteobubalina]|uniref:Uncharacterized protein n=1 Tax=Armillaria luteobubalina TaxID=153913 RepID=A0AA39QF28_9AGAR|nr:hypothetical protein EDD18DRAFT_1431876 [Armillaria luteobubalina]
MTTVCYIGEAPDDHNCCPSCGMECMPSNMKTGIGKHLHECAASHKLHHAQVSACDTFKPSHCLWNGCSKVSTVWQTRDTHRKHLEAHLTWLSSLSTSGKTRCCMWELCEEPTHTDWYISDWAFHFVADHGINLNKAIIVDHCALCGEWVEDQKGDRSAWNAHCKTHYKTIFAPFKQCLQGHVLGFCWKVLERQSGIVPSVHE